MGMCLGGRKEEQRAEKEEDHEGERNPRWMAHMSVGSLRNEKPSSFVISSDRSAYKVSEANRRTSQRL
jgi:hypothetical protein